MVKTRTVVQTRTHAQKYFQKVSKSGSGGGEDSENEQEVTNEQSEKEMRNQKLQIQSFANERNCGSGSSESSGSPPKNNNNNDNSTNNNNNNNNNNINNNGSNNSSSSSSSKNNSNANSSALPSSSNPTLEDCLKSFTATEELDENSWYCDHCKKLSSGSVSSSLSRLPDLLILHIKRFGMTARFREKIRAKVKFPLNSLDMKPFITPKGTLM